MLSAFISGSLGTALVLGIGMKVLGMTVDQAVLCVAASNVGGFAALMVVIRFFRVRGAGRTWFLFLAVYFGVMLSAAEPLRSVGVFLWLVIPLILSAGFCIIAFGPIQDWFVARNQRRQRGA